MFTIQIWNDEFSAWRCPVREANFETLTEAEKRVRQLSDGARFRVLDPQGDIALAS